VTEPQGIQGVSMQRLCKNILHISFNMKLKWY